MSRARAGSTALSVAAALALFGSAPAAFAQSEALVEKTPTNGIARTLPPIQIRISIARASQNAGKVDPAALDIFEHLPAKFHSITLLDDRMVAVPMGDQAHVNLPTGGEMRLLPVGVHGQQLHVQLEMTDGMSTSMRLANNRAFYVGGVHLGEDTLVIKLVPEFGAYVDKNSARTAGIPSIPNVDKASSKR